ncbi:hypothetical protein, partial [Anaplasma marginale]|uniref:hypothetical protein n=1 Tax=Anaplasma marginale TaxID=770 RepID=UPI0018E9EC24
MNQIDRPATLIVGVDSKIGSSYKAYLDRLGEPVLGTIMFQDQVNETTFYLNLEEDVSDWQAPDKSIQSAIFCSGITNTKFCTQNPIESAKINVEATLSIMEKLINRGIQVIFFPPIRYLMELFPTVQPVSQHRQKLNMENKKPKW